MIHSLVRPILACVLQNYDQRFYCRIDNGIIKSKVETLNKKQNLHQLFRQLRQIRF